MPRTLPELLNTAPVDAPSLLALGRRALDYAGLRGQCGRTFAAVNALGVGRGDRVGIVLTRGAAGKLQRIGLAGKPGLGA